MVFDRYQKLSIKTSCRSARAKGFSCVYKLTEDSPLPKQDIVLKVIANKEQIIQLVVDKLLSTEIPHGKRVIVTGPDPRPVEVGDGPQPTTITHEEADIIMVHHMVKEAMSGHSPIQIVSDDTDVLLLLVHHLNIYLGSLPCTVRVFMESCSGNRAVIDVNEVVKKHKSIIPNLLAAHALTGCDSVSSLAGIGKAKMFNKLQKFTDSLDLGDPSSSPEDVISSCLKFVAMLYGQEPEMPLNTMRSTIFMKKIAGKRHSPPVLSHLPPTMAGFTPHCQRAHYQTILWKSAALPSPPDLNPLHYGWQLKSSVLLPIHILPGQPAAPDEVLHIISCNCKKGCRTTQCSCTKLSLACTEFCHCMGEALCENPMKVVVESDSENDDIGDVYAAESYEP